MQPDTVVLTTMSATNILRLAVCLFPVVTALDFVGPVEVFSFLIPEVIKRVGVDTYPEKPRYTLDVTYLAYDLDPMTTAATGPGLLAQRTYEELNNSSEQFDILLIPGGPGARPHNVLPSLNTFIQKQAPSAKYILTVCTGSWILANTGLLNGKNATTNKASFNTIKANTSSEINWVPQARWVVDGNIWTSSGVSAGMDMASGFVEHLVGEDVARFIRGRVEVSVHSADDDEFAVFNGLP